MHSGMDRPRRDFMYDAMSCPRGLIILLIACEYNKLHTNESSRDQQTRNT